MSKIEIDLIQMLRERWRKVETVEDREEFISFVSNLDIKLRREGKNDIADKLYSEYMKLLESDKNQKLLMLKRVREIRNTLKSIDLEVDELKDEIKKIRKEIERIIKPYKDEEKRLRDRCAELLSEKFKLLNELRDLEEKLKSFR